MNESSNLSSVSENTAESATITQRRLRICQNARAAHCAHCVVPRGGPVPAHCRHTQIFFVDVRERQVCGISKNYLDSTFIAISAGQKLPLDRVGMQSFANQSPLSLAVGSERIAEFRSVRFLMSSTVLALDLSSSADARAAFKARQNRRRCASALTS